MFSSHDIFCRRKKILLLVVYYLLLCSLLATEFPEQSIAHENPEPTWETQQQARVLQLRIPAPRGQITDRNGYALAQDKISFNLSLQFPTPETWNDNQVISFVNQNIKLIKRILPERKIKISDSFILKYYRYRGILSMTLVDDLNDNELSILKNNLHSPNLMIEQVYIRYYPNKNLASHLIGYIGKKSNICSSILENNAPIFSEIEGRDGIEKSFNEQLSGYDGLLQLSYDANGKKVSENLIRRPISGHTVVTTLDKNLQMICEDVLKENCKRGAIIFISPQDGEIHALASWPNYDLNNFSIISLKKLLANPDKPLIARAFRSSYSPGSAFKPIVALAGFESGKLKLDDTYEGTTSINIGNYTFHNWKKRNVGKLNFIEALTESCNTWFIQAGLKIGATNIIRWAQLLGLGKKTGLPLKGEIEGNIPTDSYMLRVQKRKILSGDLANMSIGQGDILVSPLQLAQAYGILANNGIFHQTRLIKQIQSLDNTVVSVYPDNIKNNLCIQSQYLTTLKQGLIAVVNNDRGTAKTARIPNFQIAGKTGTAQWGPKEHQKTIAWFAGFVPADNPQYAFVAMYEGEENDNRTHGGIHAAPLIVKVIKKFYHLSSSSEEKKNKNNNRQMNEYFHDQKDGDEEIE